jgi:hypothetical protein
MENLCRLGWALLVPLLICAGLAAIVTDAGEGGFWLMFAATLAIGALALVSAPWRPVARVVATILYLPVMGILVILLGITVSCSVHGCH